MLSVGLRLQENLEAWLLATLQLHRRQMSTKRSDVNSPMMAGFNAVPIFLPV